MNIKSEKTSESEEIIFYLDLSTEFLKKKTLLKSIKSFSEGNNKANIDSTYGFVIFKKEKEVFSVYDKDTSFIIETIDDLWEEREIGSSYFENGLYETLAHVFKKSRTFPKRYRVIVFSDSPSTQSEDYHSALYNLVLKAKNFSTYIDIIRIGEEKFYDDDVKLKVITSETYGGTLYCSDNKQFSNYLNSLIRSKSEFNMIQTESSKISEDEHIFYDRLATDLITISPDDNKTCILCEQKICPICEALSDEVHKCYNCDGPYHSCCATEYSIVNNIGLPYIFRCPQCSAILKLDKDFVNMVLEEKSEDQMQAIEKEPAIEPSIDLDETDRGMQERITKKVKVGGFFGKEISVDAVKSNNEVGGQSEEKMTITALRPPKARKTIQLCSICGATVKNSHICPVCGSKIS